MRHPEQARRSKQHDQAKANEAEESYQAEQ
jgi:hypothetical protein